MCFLSVHCAVQLHSRASVQSRARQGEGGACKYSVSAFYQHQLQSPSSCPNPIFDAELRRQNCVSLVLNEYNLKYSIKYSTEWIGTTLKYAFHIMLCVIFISKYLYSPLFVVAWDFNSIICCPFLASSPPLFLLFLEKIKGKRLSRYQLEFSNIPNPWYWKYLTIPMKI